MNSVWMTVVGSVVTVVAGGAVAVVTIVGLISNQVDSASNNPGNASSTTIDYGTSR